MTIPPSVKLKSSLRIISVAKFITCKPLQITLPEKKKQNIKTINFCISDIDVLRCCDEFLCIYHQPEIPLTIYLQFCSNCRVAVFLFHSIQLMTVTKERKRDETKRER